ncbi:hypothetical protein AB0P15_35485 [Streptomyces sp. NPDC087917]|uniref:hypothetical protein n=1 Tax=unclassified Streptomyces TaxID=2593676 RepID=UPI00341CAE9E
MTTTEWITDIALLLIVFRQLREGRLDLKTFLIPLGIVAFVAYSYLDTIPTAGNDLVLIAALVGVGAVLGIAGGVHTRVRAVGEHVLIKAGVVAAILWVVGMGARMGFQLWVQHGGAADVARFSVTHQITSDKAWVAAFVLMALTEVVTRLATIFIRSRTLAVTGPATVPAPVLDRTA